MSTIINADTSDGLKFTSDTSGEIKLQSAGTDTVTVKSDGKVGIGTSSPISQLEISGSDNNSASISTTASDYAIKLPSATTTDYFSNGIAFGEGSQINASIGSYDDGSSYRQGLWFAAYNGTSLTEWMRLESDGSVRIGQSSYYEDYNLNEKLALYGTSTANNPTIISSKKQAGSVSSNHVLFDNSNGYVGSITTNGSATAYNTSSDYRLKENNVNITDGISRVKLLKPYRFNFIVEPDKTVDGFFAHEVQSVVPEAVVGTKDEVDAEGNPVYQGIDQSKLVPLLTAALQEAITKIEDLETRIQALENA